MNLDLKIKIRSLNLISSSEPELYVTAQVLLDDYPIHAVAQCTHCCSVTDASKVFWGEWLTLPIMYCDLHLNAMVQLKVWSPTDGLLGETQVPLFDQVSRLRRGRVQVPLEDPHGARDNTSMPRVWRVSDSEKLRSRIWRVGEMYNHDELLKIGWLDDLARKRTSDISTEVRLEDLACADKKNLVLTLEFPYFDCPVLFEERPYFSERMDAILMRSGEEQEERERSLSRNEIKEEFPWASHFSVVHDPELLNAQGRTMEAKEIINPVEEKYRKLNPSMVRGVVDKNLKPNKDERAELNKIIESSGKLNRRHEDLLWKFSYSLTTDKKALVKFVMSVNWENPIEVQLAEELLLAWVRIDISDALRLLSHETEFRNNVVRSHAIKILDLANDTELLLYLLPLVQALRYDDNIAQVGSLQVSSPDIEDPPGLLATFLIRRAINSESLVSFFSWYISTEIENKDKESLFQNIRNDLFSQLRSSSKGRILEAQLSEQVKFVKKVTEMGKEGRGRAIARQNYLQRMLEQEEGKYHSLCKLAVPVLHPLRPSKRVIGVEPATLKVFSSKTQPFKLDLIMEGDDDMSPAMFKVGDDLRQDQLVLQLLGVMDKMFKDVNLDLHLTLYRVLSFSSDEGMMEFVKGSTPLTAVQKQFGTINAFFQSHAAKERQKAIEQQHEKQQSLVRIPSEAELYEDMVNRFIKSCAGYCMCTYVLCVGDRHLDNIMLRETGELFHIDFGYIFGHDPRSWAVGPIRLTKDMVDTMGGRGSKGFDKFVSHCSQAYRVLRANASLILNLLHLMKDSNIDNLFDDHETVVQIVRDRFELDRSEQSAEIWLLEKLNQCEDTFMTTISDALHNANVFLN